MPQIREYVARGTSPARLAAPRISGHDLTPSAELVQLGKTLGDLTAQYMQTRRETQVAKQAAESASALQQYVFELQNGKTDAAGNFIPPADPSEQYGLFRDKVKEINQAAAQNLGDEQLVERFQLHLAPLVTAQGLDVQRVALDRQKNQVIADLNDQETALAQVIVDTGSTAGEHATETTARNTLKATYARMVTAGVLTPAQAGDRLEKFDQMVSRTFLRRDIRTDPTKALHGLETGAYAGLANPEEREQWKAYALDGIRAKAIEDERLQRKHEKMLADQREATKSDFVDRWETNSLGVDDIRHSNLMADEKEHFYRLIKIDASTTKDDPSTVFDLFRRIHLPDGDTRKITNENQLYPYVGNGLGIEGLNHLRKEIEDLRNPQNLSLNETRKNFLAATKSSMTRANPLLGIQDPAGDREFYTFWQYVMAKEGELRSKGEDVFQLYDPRSKEFLGSPETLKMFQRPVGQVMEDNADALRRESTPIQWPGQSSTENIPYLPRKPGETAEQWADRARSEEGSHVLPSAQVEQPSQPSQPVERPSQPMDISVTGETGTVGPLPTPSHWFESLDERRLRLARERMTEEERMQADIEAMKAAHPKLQ